MAASDEQMQHAADERLRVRAEQARAFILACRDDLAALTDEFARGNDGGDPWADNRTDGPPKLLASLDFQVYQGFLTQLINAVDNTPNAGSDNTLFVLNANFGPFLTACVRPLGSGAGA